MLLFEFFFGVKFMTGFFCVDVFVFVVVWFFCQICCACEYYRDVLTKIRKYAMIDCCSFSSDGLCFFA